jgi:Fur family ferric uptake transcriptional regulator
MCRNWEVARYTGAVTSDPSSHLRINDVRDLLRSHGLRWTPQRRALVEVLARTNGHVTTTELIERCREVDPATIPSTVYRTMDVLEEVGLVRHGHGADGREEFHVLPEAEHGHLHCQGCGGTWEIDAEEGGEIVRSLEGRRGFAVDLSHVTIVGRCATCRAQAPAAGPV